MDFRTETDTMGDVRVPASAYYGAQTQRAADNFPISGLRFSDDFIQHLALVKHAAAKVNGDLGRLEPGMAGAIAQAAREVMDGCFRDQFVVDLFQTGSGTSTNMNMNEVLATRANEILTGVRNARSPVHPNDHVNSGQSSNDVIPTVLHLTAMVLIRTRLIPSLENLHGALSAKAGELDQVMKIGRTHLQDAVPMSLGQEFSGYARQISLGLERIRSAEPRLSELALGGTAVGSGLNAPPGFAPAVIEALAGETGIGFTEARNHFEAQACQDAAVETSGALKTVAVSLVKIANDIRWLASGPRCGLGEITLPSLQPGSSIMPGKVNPVIPEVVIQVAAQVIGNDAAITLGGLSGNFELNVMLPVITRNLLESISLTASAASVFSDKCIPGITANPEKCRENLRQSLALATHLIPRIGYDRAAKVAKKAFATGKTIRQTVLEEDLLPEDLLDRLLDQG